MIAWIRPQLCGDRERESPGPRIVIGVGPERPDDGVGTAQQPIGWNAIEQHGPFEEVCLGATQRLELGSREPTDGDVDVVFTLDPSKCRSARV
jgi:hypothetical protein